MEKKEYIPIVGKLTAELYSQTLQQVLRLQQREDFEQSKIIVMINSSGGSIPVGFALYDIFSSMKNVYTLINGYSGSMTSLLYLAAPLEKRLITPHSYYMLHSYTETPPPNIPLTPHELQSLLSETNADIEVSKQIILSKTYMTKEQVDQSFDKFAARNFNAKECIDYGIASQITPFSDIFKL